jgi:hypothetical protein
MNDSNSPSNPGAPRATLKLKAGARKPPTETKPPAESRAQPHPEPPKKGNFKPGAHWSDEYKERMQADMDALTPRRR